jgi:CRISPR-associated endonuclease/helicase Cas3
VEEWVGDGVARGDPAHAKTEQELDWHLKRTERKANEIGLRIGLPEPARRLLANAAAVHDLGKMRTNWQAYAGNTGYPRTPTKPQPLAKFTTRGNPNLLRIGEITYRHEFGSLRDITDQDVFAGLDSEALDLGLHMVVAHHGNGRPVIPAVDEKTAPAVSAELAREVALRYTRLQKRWGPWGLAWWETLLRAADAAASREPTDAETDSEDGGRPVSRSGSEVA